jgi:hypothetical protein
VLNQVNAAVLFYRNLTAQLTPGVLRVVLISYEKTVAHTSAVSTAPQVSRGQMADP